MGCGQSSSNVRQTVSEKSANAKCSESSISNVKELNHDSEIINPEPESTIINKNEGSLNKHSNIPEQASGIEIENSQINECEGISEQSSNKYINENQPDKCLDRVMENYEEKEEIFIKKTSDDNIHLEEMNEEPKEHSILSNQEEPDQELGYNNDIATDTNLIIKEKETNDNIIDVNNPSVELMNENMEEDARNTENIVGQEAVLLNELDLKDTKENISEKKIT